MTRKDYAAAVRHVRETRPLLVRRVGRDVADRWADSFEELAAVSHDAWRFDLQAKLCEDERRRAGLELELARLTRRKEELQEITARVDADLRLALGE